MASWTSKGHAMRRRAGEPSNHHESVGVSMTRNLPTPEEVLASAEHANSPRRYMGMEASSATVAAPQAGTLVPRKNTQAGDLTGGKGGPRPAIAAERLGAKFAPQAKFPPMIDPAAGATMANAKIIPSVVGRQAPNFGMGVQDQY